MSLIEVSLINHTACNETFKLDEVHRVYSIYLVSKVATDSRLTYIISCPEAKLS